MPGGLSRRLDVALAVHKSPSMKSSLTSAAIVFVLTALLGTALNARANAKGAEPAPQTATVYWAQ